MSISFFITLQWFLNDNCKPTFISLQKPASSLQIFLAANYSLVMSWSGILFSKSSRLMAVSKIFMFNTCRAYMLMKIHWHSVSSNNQLNIDSSGSKSWPPCAWQIFPQDQVLVFCACLYIFMHILCSLCNLIIPHPFLTNATGHCIIMLWYWPLTLYYLTQAYNFISHAPFYILNSSSVLTNRNKLHELRPEVCHKMSCIEGNCVKVATYYSLV